MSDLFLSEDVRRVLKGKHVVILGDSNIRGLYKDIVWLINDNSFIPYECLGAKGEARFPDFSNWKSGNKKISPRIRSIFNDSNRDHLLKFNGLHSGRGYIEPRHYYREEDDIHLHYVFITRVWSKDLDEWLDTFGNRNDGAKIEVLLMSSCLWDFNRWGPFGVTEYKQNISKLLKRVKECLPPQGHFVWLTALPVSKELNSKAMQVPGLEFQCMTSRYNVIEANFYTTHKVVNYGYHVIDMHYYANFQSFRRNPDGIHWSPESNRWFTNLIMTFLCLIMKKTLPGRVPNNISLEKIKLMARVAQDGDPSGGDKISSKDVQKKLEELTILAQKMTPKEMQILSELKKADTGLNQQKPKNQRMMRGGNRMHPYDNGNSNRARPPRGGPGRGQMKNCRQVAHEGFGPMMGNRTRVPIWQNQPQPWRPGLETNQREPWAPAIEQNQMESWRFDQQNQQIGRPRMEPSQREMWRPDDNQRETWGSCSEPNLRDFRGPLTEPNHQENWNSDIEPNMTANQRSHNLDPSQLGEWKSSLESNQRGPGLEPNQRQRWRSGSDINLRGSGSNQRNEWGPGLDQNQRGQWGLGPGLSQRNEWGPGFEPNRQRDPAWQLDLDPIPTFPVELPRPRPPSPPEIGKRLNSSLDSSFINPMFRGMLAAGIQTGSRSSDGNTVLQQQQTSSFADDDDDCGLGFGPLRRQNSQEAIGPRTSQDMSRPSSGIGQPRLRPLMSNFGDPSNFQFKTLDELQRAQQQQQRQRAQHHQQFAQQELQQFCPPGWSRGNHF